MSAQSLDLKTRTTLLDGRIVSMRRLNPDDAESVCRLHDRLGEQGRYFRFFTHRPAHLTELVHRLTTPGDGHVAVGAFDGDRLIGVANFASGDDPGVADVAITVADDEHLHALLRRLAQLAQQQGIRRLAADVLSANRLMFKVVNDAGWPAHRTGNGSVIHLEIDLPGAG
ncbi:MAG: N-acetyltransferase [Mycobacterium sp.]